MKLGLYIDMRNPPQWQRPWAAHYQRWLERIEEAERLGAEMVWLTEHHFFDDGYLPQCWTLAAAIAVRTTTIRIGSAVNLLPLHSSIELAEQIALADVLSGGRMEPGFGVGYRKPEYQAFDGDFKRRYGVFERRICELRQLWGELPGAARTVTPGPLQAPMPMWGGFHGPMGARMAGRLGLGLLDINRAQLEEYKNGLAQGGYPLTDARLAARIDYFVTDDPEKTWRILEPHVMYRWRSYNRYMAEGTSREADPPERFDAESIKNDFLIGDAQHIASEINKRTCGLPVTHIYCWSDYPGIPDEMIDEHLRLSFTELSPLLRAGQVP